MIDKWITATPEAIGMVLFSALVTYVAILAYTRIAGLRSFSKMTAVDFAMTIAVGSLFATTIVTASPPLIQGLVAIAALYFGQWALAFARQKSEWFSSVVDNQPLLLMKGSEIHDQNLRKSNVTRSDLFGKLREANVLKLDQVLAVVFESTGDISVLHSSDESMTLDPEILESVSS